VLFTSPNYVGRFAWAARVVTSNDGRERDRYSTVRYIHCIAKETSRARRDTRVSFCFYSSYKKQGPRYSNSRLVYADLIL